jgi:hypothetical protein
MRRSVWLSATLFLLASGPASVAHADVTAQSDAGFVLSHSAETSAAKADVWRALIAPARWWSSDHTYSGNADNLYLDAQATGCFCEKLPRPADAPEGQRMGSIEHMHVIYADPQRGVLRMSGGLGPLQGEAAHGTLTIALKQIETGTRIEWTYVVGGYIRMNQAELVPAVDQVLGQQLIRLAEFTAKSAQPAPVEPAAKPN